jgi:hypothetical protein
MKDQKTIQTPALAIFLAVLAFLPAKTADAQTGGPRIAAPRSVARPQGDTVNDPSVFERGPFGGGTDPAAVSSAYRLIGTVEGEVFTGAVLDDAAGTQIFYRVGDTLPDGSQIVKVQSDNISLKRSDGIIYELYITHDTKTAAPPMSPVNNAGPPTPRFTDDQRMVDMQARMAGPRRPDMIPGQAPGTASNAGARWGGGRRDLQHNAPGPNAAQGAGTDQ